MAKQAGPIILRGSFPGITFYVFNGKPFARNKSSLDEKRFHTDPAFAGSRASSTRFGQANKLASKVYHQVPKRQRQKALYARLKKTALTLAHQGKEAAEIVAVLEGLLPPAAALPVSNEALPGRALNKEITE